MSPANKLAKWEQVPETTYEDQFLPLVVAQETQRELLNRNVSLPRLLLDPKFPKVKSVNIIDSVTGGDVERTIEGASTVTINLHDKDRKLLQSGLFNLDDDGYLARIEIKIDGLAFRLVKVGKTADDLSLVFEDREVQLLRGGKGKPLKARRGQVTRAEFIHKMVREVKKPRLKFYSPEQHEDQDIAGSEHHRRRTEKKRNDRRKPGVTRAAKLTVKGWPATDEQLRNMEIVLDQAVEDKAPKVVMVAVIAGTINESTIRNLTYGDRDSIGILQLRVGYHGRAAAGSITQSVHLFITKKGGFTGATPGNANDLAKRGWSAAAIAGSVMNNIGTYMYGPHVAEATKIVEAYTGGDLPSGGSSSSSTRTRTKPYEYRRGRKESSWDAGQRLAAEVGWRLFVVSGVVYYVSEEYLFRSRARYRISEESEGVDYIDFDWDRGKPVASCTVSCRANRWEALPGSIVIVEGSGPANGRWLVSSISRPIFSADASIALRKPIRERNEPAPERVEVSTPRRATRGSGGESHGKGATGNLDWPVRGPITSPFGQRWGRLHDGIDIGVSFVPCHAADGGRVVVAGQNGGYGNYIEIDHGNGLHTFYGHLSRIGVRVGQNVSKGDVIGTTGNSGSSTGPHLHFGVHKNGVGVDPMKMSVSDIDILISRERDGADELSGAVAGSVAVAPGAVDERMGVIVTELGQGTLFEDVRWPARGATLPSVGDDVLVIFDGDGEPWVIAWWPYDD